MYDLSSKVSTWAVTCLLLFLKRIEEKFHKCCSHFSYSVTFHTWQETHSSLIKTFLRKVCQFHDALIILTKLFFFAKLLDFWYWSYQNLRQNVNTSSPTLHRFRSVTSQEMQFCHLLWKLQTMVFLNWKPEKAPKVACLPCVFLLFCFWYC